MTLTEYLHARAKIKTQDAAEQAGHAEVAIRHLLQGDAGPEERQAILNDLAHDAQLAADAWERATNKILAALIEIEVGAR